MNRFLFIIIATLVVSLPVQAQNKAAIEKQFQTWLKNDLWPEAKRNGVSSRKFKQAFKGVTLNWKLPDLVPPGTKAKPSRPQAQAEFKSPARYFNENNMGAVVATGRKLSKKPCFHSAQCISGFKHKSIYVDAQRAFQKRDTLSSGDR